MYFTQSTNLFFNHYIFPTADMLIINLFGTTSAFRLRIRSGPSPAVCIGSLNPFTTGFNEHWVSSA